MLEKVREKEKKIGKKVIFRLLFGGKSLKETKIGGNEDLRSCFISTNASVLIKIVIWCSNQGELDW